MEHHGYQADLSSNGEEFQFIVVRREPELFRIREQTIICKSFELAPVDQDPYFNSLIVHQPKILTQQFSTAALIFNRFVGDLEPDYIRSNNVPEFTARAVRGWLSRIGVTTLFIEPGSPRENGYIESAGGKLRDELRDCEMFDTLLEAKVLMSAGVMSITAFACTARSATGPPPLGRHSHQWLASLRSTNH